MKMRIKKGDAVRMLTGKDAGKSGQVLRALPRVGRVVVEGANMIKRHRKPRRQGEKGQIVEVARAVDVSNVSLVCPHCLKATRVGYSLGTDGSKRRICKRCNDNIDV